MHTRRVRQRSMHTCNLQVPKLRIDGIDRIDAISIMELNGIVDGPIKVWYPHVGHYHSPTQSRPMDARVPRPTGLAWVAVVRRPEECPRVWPTKMLAPVPIRSRIFLYQKFKLENPRMMVNGNFWVFTLFGQKKKNCILRVLKIFHSDQMRSKFKNCHSQSSPAASS